MKVELGGTDGNTQHLILEGRLDVAGAEEADLRLTTLAGSTRGNILLDLAGVSILASIGIRLLITVARAQKGRGGALVLCSPQPMVRKSLLTAGIDQIIPVYDSIDEARSSFARG